MLRQYELIELVRQYTPELDEGLLNTAYVYAMQKHGNQTRSSGDPYFAHPLEVAAILAQEQADMQTIATALLHSTVDDTDATKEEIVDIFGSDIAENVIEVTRILRITQSLHSSLAPPLDIIRALVVMVPSETTLKVLCAKAAALTESVAMLAETKRKRVLDFNLSVFWPISRAITLTHCSSLMQTTAKINSQQTDNIDFIISNIDKMEKSCEHLFQVNWKNLYNNSEYSLLNNDDQLVDLDDTMMVQLSRMKQNELDTLLSDAFRIISKLPAGEIKRLSETAKKKLEKWPEEIPRRAPELYNDRPASEGLPDFLRRAYGERGYLNNMLTTAHLDILDKPAADAVRSWISHHGSLPDDIKLPGKINRDRQPPRKTRVNP